MSRITGAERFIKLYNFSFIIHIIVSSFSHSLYSDNSCFLSSLKDFQFIYPLFTIENAF